MKSYKDLDIYNVSKQLAIKVHKMTMELPKFEMYEEGGQVRRSSKSVASMIVEGYGRKRYKADFIKYLVYSHAECDETILHLDFLLQTKSAKDEARINQLKIDYVNLNKRIYTFIRWAEDNFDPDQTVHEPELSGWSLASQEGIQQPEALTLKTKT